MCYTDQFAPNSRNAVASFWIAFKHVHRVTALQISQKKISRPQRGVILERFFAQHRIISNRRSKSTIVTPPLELLVSAYLLAWTPHRARFKFLRIFNTFPRSVFPSPGRSVLPQLGQVRERRVEVQNCPFDLYPQRGQSKMNSVCKETVSLVITKLSRRSWCTCTLPHSYSVLTSLLMTRCWVIPPIRLQHYLRHDPMIRSDEGQTLGTSLAIAIYPRKRQVHNPVLYRFANAANRVRSRPENIFCWLITSGFSLLWPRFHCCCCSCYFRVPGPVGVQTCARRSHCGSQECGNPAT